MPVNGNESQDVGKWVGAGQVFGLLAGLLVFTGFAMIERQQVTLGSNIRSAAAEIGTSVGHAGKLTPACTELATQLAEETLRERLSGSKGGEEALDAYLGWPCPMRALPGISFGVNDSIRNAYDGA